MGNNPNLHHILIRVCALAMKNLSQMNITYQNQQILKHKSVNIGLAISSHMGLVVPVISGADNLGLEEISRAVKSLTEGVRDNCLLVSDMAVKSMVVSNIGMYGVSTFLAIIDIPDSMIFAVGHIADYVVPE